MTSVELLRYIDREYPGHASPAASPSIPTSRRTPSSRRWSGRSHAGASFIITQPIIGRDDRLAGLEPFGLPVTLDAWMSKKLHLLSECVGHEIPEGTPYDPIENLRGPPAPLPRLRALPGHPGLQDPVPPAP
ncbi:MAG: hypothetical protein MZU91_11405 [Desulfosudis oleivorans]|nr:hypothetical protein [Desulfosudis oleivorans]